MDQDVHLERPCCWDQVLKQDVEQACPCPPATGIWGPGGLGSSLMQGSPVSCLWSDVQRNTPEQWIATLQSWIEMPRVPVLPLGCALSRGEGLLVSFVSLTGCLLGRGQQLLDAVAL